MSRSNFIGQAGMIIGLPHDDPETKYHMLEWANDHDVRKVIKMLSVRSLGISMEHGQSEIDKNPESFGYQMQTPFHHRWRFISDAWRTATYDSTAAEIDANWLMTQLDIRSPWSQNIGTWHLPWVLWLDSDNREKILGKIRNFDPDRDAFNTWHNRVIGLDQQWHRNYLKSMHDLT